MTDYGDLIQSSFGKANPALPITVGNIDEDPDRAQRAIDFSRATGVSSTAIFGDLDEFERQHKAVAASDIVANNPHLGDWVQSDPMAPKIANDDYGNLDSVSQKVTGLNLPSVRAISALGRAMFPDNDPLKRFKEGGHLGSWLSSKDIQNHPIASAIAAGIGTPIELIMRGISGTAETGADIAANVATAAGAPGLGRELGALVEAEAMGLTGRHGVHAPTPYQRVRPYLENGREPPPTVLPEYDAYRAKQNADDVTALKEATSDAQSSLTRERSPDLFRDFIAQHTDAEIGVGGDAAAALYGDKTPTPDDGLLGWVPGIADKLELARASGDDISIPLADWLTHVDPKVMDALHDDLRIRPGGITAREAQLGTEADTAKPPAIPIPEEVPTVRGAAGLEPMFSIGDRKLQLARMEKNLPDPNGRFTSLQGFHDFHLLDEQGNPVGYINISEQKGGKQLYVDMVSGINGLGPRDFGPALMRDMLRQIKAEFPNAESISGHRVSGAREAAGKEMTMPAPVIKLDNPKGWERAEAHDDFRRVLEGGQWETFSKGTQAYIKPYFENAAQDRRMIDAVNEELRRIIPQKVTVRPAERIISSDAQGQSGPIEPTGVYLRSREAYPIILYALEGPDPLGTARHEAIHHLRNYGFFTKEEWATLERAANTGGAMNYLDIHNRYPTGSLPLKLEEAIADSYKDWEAGRVQMPPEVQGIFAKLKAFFDAIRERIAQMLGKPPTWEDIFQKVSTGEIGSREGTTPLDARAFNETKLSVEDLRKASNDNYLTKEEQEIVQDHLDTMRGIERYKASVDKMTDKEFDARDKRWEEIINKILDHQEGLEPKLSAPGLRPAIVDEDGSIKVGRVGQMHMEIKATNPKDSGWVDHEGNFLNHEQATAYTEKHFSRGAEYLEDQAENGPAATMEEMEQHLKNQTPAEIADDIYINVGGTNHRAALQEFDGSFSPEDMKNDPRLAKARKIIADNLNDLDVKLSTPEDPSRVFERAAALGMTVDQFKAYDKLIAKQHAEDIEAATDRATKQQARQQTKEWKANRVDLRKEVANSIRNRPDVATDLFLAGDGLYGRQTKQAYKLDADLLTDKQKAMLPPKYYGPGGLAPDDVANMFGYGSGDAMVDKLTKYNALKSATGMNARDFVSKITDVETDRQMRIKYGVLDDNIMDAVKEQVVGDTQLNILHEETVALGLKAGQASAPFTKADIIGWVKQEFAKTTIGSASSDRYMATAGRAGKAAEMALLQNDPATAFQQKQRQYYATALAREAKQLENEIDKFERVAKRFSKREVNGIDVQYTNFIQDILLRVGKPVRRSVQDLAAAIQAGEYHSLQEFVDGKNGFYLREVAVDDRLFDPGFRRKFESLTTNEFNGVNTSIKSLVKNGRDEQKITRAGEEADLKVIKNQMIDQLEQFKERTYDAKGGRWMGPIPPPIAKLLRSYGTAHIQMENLFNRWDRDDPKGVFQQYIMRDLVDASNNESVMEKRYAARLRGVDDKADLKQGVDNPLFKVPGTDSLMKFNRGNLRTIMLNMGNDGNMVKMAKGYKVEPAAMAAWVHQHATKEDWDWVQKIWDTFADLKTESDTMYHGLSGVPAESIPIRPVQTPHGVYPGGYYPVIWHPEFEGPSKKLMGKDALEQDGFVRATVANGYTKQRTGYVGPMALDLDMLPARMKQMIHDIAMRPAVINASKIFYDKDVRGAIAKHFGNEWRDMLVPYLVDVANAANYVPKDQRMFYNASEFLRQNLVSTLVGLNPGTVLKHGPTALAQSLHEVGTINFLRALKGMVSINERTSESNWQFAMKESEELQRRHQNYVETLGGASEMLMPNTGYASLRATIQRLSASPVAISDLLSAVPTWLAQYEKSLADNGGVHGDAVYDANRAVRRAHGSVAITNRSTVMRGGALGQWFASVYGFFNHIMNRQYELLWKSGEALDMVKDGEYRQAMAQAPELTSMLFAYILAPALIEEMVTPLMSTDNESWGKKAAKGVAFTLGASWVGIRDIASAILNSRDPSVGLISTFGKSMTDVARDLGKQGPFNREHAGKIIKDGATLLGSLSGVVPSQVGRVAEFGHGVATGTERPKGPWGWLAGARYGTLKGHAKTFDEWQRHH